MGMEDIIPSLGGDDITEAKVREIATEITIKKTIEDEFAKYDKKEFAKSLIIRLYSYNDFSRLKEKDAYKMAQSKAASIIKYLDKSFDDISIQRVARSRKAMLLIDIVTELYILSDFANNDDKKLAKDAYARGKYLYKQLTKSTTGTSTPSGNEGGNSIIDNPENDDSNSDY